MTSGSCLSPIAFLVNHIGIRHFFQDLIHHHYYSCSNGEDCTIGFNLVSEPYMEDGKAKVESWTLEVSFYLNEKVPWMRWFMSGEHGQPVAVV